MEGCKRREVVAVEQEAGVSDGCQGNECNPS